MNKGEGSQRNETQHGISLQLKTVVLCPFLHHAVDHVLHLRIVRAPQQDHHFLQLVWRFFPSNSALENTNCCTSLSLPELWVWVEPLKDVECLARVVEVSHLVTVIRYEVQKVEGLIACVHPDVGLPCKCRLVVHDVTPGQPTEVTELCPVLLVLDLQQRLLGLLVVARRGASDAVVPVEIVVVREVRFDRFEVHKHVLELPQQEEAGGHALPAWNGVTLRGGSAYELEELLCELQVLTRARALAERRKDHALEDVLARHSGLQVLDEVVGLDRLVGAQVVYH
mmetsp:Transcript_89414/g.248345  ORF Transcript_89414/g.248345 Transcript_89414/m.248345 type:complete len:283 (-) Transcript_89414:957-1805(-)